MYNSKHLLLYFYPDLPIFYRLLSLIINIIYDVYYIDINPFALYFYYKEIIILNNFYKLDKLVKLNRFYTRYCCICNLDQNDKIITLQCGHSVHEECNSILIMLSKNEYCPKCRINF